MPVPVSTRLMQLTRSAMPGTVAVAATIEQSTRGEKLIVSHDASWLPCQFQTAAAAWTFSVFNKQLSK